jgi:hypothetical protein
MIRNVAFHLAWASWAAAWPWTRAQGLSRSRSTTAPRARMPNFGRRGQGPRPTPRPCAQERRGVLLMLTGPHAVEAVLKRCLRVLALLRPGTPWPTDHRDPGLQPLWRNAWLAAIAFWWTRRRCPGPRSPPRTDPLLVLAGGPGRGPGRAPWSRSSWASARRSCAAAAGAAAGGP